jgi:hypothetical protein
MRQISFRILFFFIIFICVKSLRQVRRDLTYLCGQAPYTYYSNIRESLQLSFLLVNKVNAIINSFLACQQGGQQGGQLNPGNR